MARQHGSPQRPAAPGGRQFRMSSAQQPATIYASLPPVHYREFPLGFAKREGRTQRKRVAGDGSDGGEQEQNGEDGQRSARACAERVLSTDRTGAEEAS